MYVVPIMDFKMPNENYFLKKRRMENQLSRKKVPSV